MGKHYTLSELAQLTGARVHGDPNCTIVGLASLQEAKEGNLSFLANPLYRKYLADTKASAVILSESDLSFCPVNALVIDDPYVAYARITHCFAPLVDTSVGIHPSATVGKNVKIDATARIEATAVIGDDVVIGAHTIIGAGTVIGNHVQIGESTLIHPKVSIYANSRIGNRVIIQSGAVIGSDGFGFAFDKQKMTYIKIYHAGSVIIEDDVEIGSNTTIDRGALTGTNTLIERHVKIDNLVQIAHNVVIGAYTVIAGCAGVAGSAKIGKFCQIGGAACVNGHVEIADNVKLSGMAMATHSLTTPGAAYSSGTGIMENTSWRKNAVRFRHLDELARRVQQLEKGES